MHIKDNSTEKGFVTLIFNRYVTDIVCIKSNYLHQIHIIA